MAKLAKGYNFAALIVFNTLLTILVLNFFCFVIFKVIDRFGANVIAKKYQDVDLKAVYPAKSSRDIDALLKETWSRNYLFEPFTQFKERPYAGRYLNIDNNGFRYTKNQGPWPPQAQNINIFLFGGSTMFGYGVSDYETIASYLQEYLTQKTGSPVYVYNFGRGSYYSTQERLLYENLLTSGFVPDLAVFLDGLNDFAYYDNEPLFTEQLRRLFSFRTVEIFQKLLSMTSLGRAADGIAGFFKKDGTNPENNLQGRDRAALLDDVIHRYAMNKKLIQAASNLFGVQTIFVWQPNPLYNYDPACHPFLDGDPGETGFSQDGYRRMADFIKANPMGDNFIWCADIQKERKQPLYVDKVHYTAAFSKELAQVIGNAILAAGDLKKAPAAKP